MDAERKASNIGPAGLEIAWQRFGQTDDPAVLLIMGLAAQMIQWPEAFCEDLAGRGLQVIRFDNRDSGQSTHMSSAPAPNLAAVLAGDLSSVSYTLSDMAADAVGLLDHLQIESAHIVGASMGGQIAQTVVIEHPGRVRSLVSMMSSTGDTRVGQPSPDAMRELFGAGPAVTKEDAIQQRVRAARAIGSPGYPGNEDEIAAGAARAYDRGHDPTATARQAIATVASGDRTEKLRRISVPTLVIHGLADRMVDVSGGRAVAEAIPGAELVLIEGMGHDMAPGLRHQLAARIGAFVLRAEGARRQPKGEPIA